MPQPASQPIPAGMHTLTPHMWFAGNCGEAIEFYQKAFGAELMAPAVPGPEGHGVMHAMMKVGTSQIMMADAWPGSWEQPPADSTSISLFVYVEDCDALYQQAVDAGCEVTCGMIDAFWGDRLGSVKDPFGHSWSIATHKQDLTPEEILQGQEEWMRSMGEQQ